MVRPQLAGSSAAATAACLLVAGLATESRGETDVVIHGCKNAFTGLLRLWICPSNTGPGGATADAEPRPMTAVTMAEIVVQ